MYGRVWHHLLYGIVPSSSPYHSVVEILTLYPDMSDRRSAPKGVEKLGQPHDGDFCITKGEQASAVLSPSLISVDTFLRTY